MLFFTACTRNFTSEQGRILKSRLVANCYLTVIAPDPNATVSLYFSDISLVYRDQCLISKLQVFDGLTDTSPLLTTACGHQLPSPVFSTGRNILIKFTNTPGNSYMASFDITYTTTTKGRGCGGTIFNYGGIFSSPFYPGNYRNNTICRWDISVPVGNVIAIKFMGIL
ncbi:hypothetical protein AAG570_010368 [Ranatra chinensis]|uniref:CUB domain-containing protein n=1 Tax=Ranatra chinensis TaxID=642074 RepID=A0ABD0Z8G9_9HEMI